MGRLLAMLLLLTLSVRAQVVTVLEGARVVDADGAPGAPTEVWIDKGRICAIGKGVQGTRRIERVDCKGKFLMPGWIDSHVHLGLVDPQAVLRGGVTSVRDLGFPLVSLQRLAALPPGAGPTLHFSGGMLTCPGGYPSSAGWAPRGTAVVIDDEAAAEREVGRLHAAGASCLKVTLEPGGGPTLELGRLKAIVRAAHQRHLLVTAHVSSLPELDKALEAGVDDLAHFLFDSSPVPQAVLERMLAHKVSICPTLHINAHPDRLANLARYARLGGCVLYGTDLGNAGPSPGIDVQEVRLMLQAGLSWREVFRSATSSAARRLGYEGEGQVAVGAWANLVLLKADPAREPANLRQIEAVWHRGTRVPLP